MRGDLRSGRVARSETVPQLGRLNISERSKPLGDYRTQPLRYSRWTYCAAFRVFVTTPRALSHSISRPFPLRYATFPSKTVNASAPLYAKLQVVVPPVRMASSHSRWCPTERGMLGSGRR